MVPVHTEHWLTAYPTDPMLEQILLLSLTSRSRTHKAYTYAPEFMVRSWHMAISQYAHIGALAKTHAKPLA